MRVKVDEDLPGAAVEMLRKRGHAAVAVVEHGMGGWKDPLVWEAVQSEHRYLVTGDKGFADVRHHPPGTHAGILLLRPAQQGIRPVLELLGSVLASHDLEDMAGAIAVATSRGIRIRRS